MLIDVVVVDEKRANVQNVDVEEKRRIGGRCQDINLEIMLIQMAPSRRSRQVRFTSHLHS